jgi:hypothetical protein
MLKKIMAKKENKIEVISEETTVLTENVNNNEKIEEINNFDSLTLQDLCYVEKAINVVCKKYENTIRNYDGSISTNTKEYERFKSINTLHSRVINKMENELLKLI